MSKSALIGWILSMALVYPGITLAAAEGDTVTGVVSHVDTEKQTIVVHNKRSEHRHTYFVTPNTQFSSQGKTLSLSDIKRGQEVTLRFAHLDTGPELLAFDVVDIDELVEFIPIELEEEIEVSGTVTGVRPQHGTLTIREKGSRAHETFHVNDTTPITGEGGSVSDLRKLQRGDEVTLRYRQTEQGLIVLSAFLPEEVLPAALPETASNSAVYLLLAFACALIGFGVYVRRKLSAQAQ